MVVKKNKTQTLLELERQLDTVNVFVSLVTFVTGAESYIIMKFLAVQRYQQKGSWCHHGRYSDTEVAPLNCTS